MRIAPWLLCFLAFFGRFNLTLYPINEGQASWREDGLSGLTKMTMVILLSLVGG